MVFSPLALRPEIPLGSGLLRIYTGRLGKALKQLESGDTTLLDQRVAVTRRRLKQARALLRLCRPVLDPLTWEQENTTLRDAGRRLAQARDAAALVATWDRAGVLLILDPTTTAPIRQRLVDRRAQELSAGGLDEVACQSVAASLRTHLGRSQDWPLDQLTPAHLVTAISRGYRQGHQLGLRARAGKASVPEFHEWRKRVKTTWYHLLVIERLAPESVTPLVQAADLLGKQLGWVQDLTILEDFLRQAPAAEGLNADHCRQTRRGIREIRREAQAQSCYLSPLLFRLRSPQFEQELACWLRAR
ncbi:MAG: hypothetical protein GEEBNDBF_01382 [bacterium]|nr:hypothetical protein [bacterium]